jgi:hypothetical protein
VVVVVRIVLPNMVSVVDKVGLGPVAVSLGALVSPLMRGIRSACESSLGAGNEVEILQVCTLGDGMMCATLNACTSKQMHAYGKDFV